ncbi:MAG: glycosyl hydrolase family 18 protein [Lachnospiraceae bacterium]|jgi:spore germination protein YaaH
MSVKKRRKKKRNGTGAAVFVVLILIVLVGIAAVHFFVMESNTPSTRQMSPSEYYGEVSSGEQLIVTTTDVCDQRGRIIDGSSYVDYETVRMYINNRVFLDKQSGILTVTTPNEIVNVNIGAEGEKRVINSDGAVLISLDFLMDYSDISIESFSDPERIVIAEGWVTDRADILEDEAPIRFEADIKSDIINKGYAGQKVTVLGEENEFVKVSTADGFIGYIDRNCIGEKYSITNHVSTIGEYPHRDFGKKINMVFHQTDSQAANDALMQSVENVSGINVIAPTWFFINDKSGNLTDITSAGYVEAAHAKGWEVWPVVNDFDGGMNSKADTLETLGSTPVRQAIAENIAVSVAACGADGVNVDIENINEDCAEAYLQFIRELLVNCSKYGLTLSVDTFVPQGYNSYIDRKELGTVSDYVVVMAYDENTSGAESAGSVSSISWVRQAVENTCELVDPSKVVIAIPFYTRKWETSNGKVVDSKAMGMSEAEKFIEENGMKTSWDDTTQQYIAETEGTPNYIMWLEEKESIEAKLKVIKEGNVAGIAEWKLGLEKSDIWAVLNKYCEE